METSTQATTATMIDSAENAGVFFPYHATATPAPLEGYRYVTCTYKQTPAMKAKGIDARDNVYVRVPVHLTVEMVLANMETIAPYVIQLLQEIEDKRIKQLHKDGATQLFPATFTLDHILSDLEDAGVSSLSGESISEWFGEYVAAALLQHLINSNKLDADNLSEDVQGKLTTMVNAYLAKFVSLASGKTKPFPKEREELTRAIEISVTGDTVIGAKILAKFAKQEADENAGIADLGGDLVGI